MSVDVQIIYTDGKAVEVKDAEQVLAATERFPYWTIWHAKEEGIKSKVSFTHINIAQHVTLWGEPQDEGNEFTEERPAFDNVVSLDSFRKEEPDGTVS